MPRPEGGYKNLAGVEVPGTHDPIYRFEDNRGLTTWKVNQAYACGIERGRRGVVDAPYKEDTTARDIGTAVHLMCELDLRGASKAKIEAAVNEKLSSKDDIDTAWNAFRHFQTWRKEHRVEVISLEEVIVSETHQYGGVPDLIAFVDGVRSNVDFKTCQQKNAKTVYDGHKVALVAHGDLWNEKHPDQLIEAYHLINLPKDGKHYVCHSFADLDIERQKFALWLAAYRLERGNPKKADVKPAAIAAPAPALEPPKPEEKPAPAPIEVKPAPAKPKRTRKPKAPPPVQLVLPEIIPAEPVQLDMLDYIADRERCPMLADFMLRHKKARSPWARP